MEGLGLCDEDTADALVFGVATEFTVASELGGLVDRWASRLRQPHSQD